MNNEQIIKALAKLGNFLKAATDNNEISDYNNFLTNSDYNNFRILLKNISLKNEWFTEENVRTAIQSISQKLNEENLNKWINKEQFKTGNKQKKIGVIMAGNLPCVGFHDFLCVLISGNKFIGKLSSEDSELLPAIGNILIKIEPEFTDSINFISTRLESFDAIIATGSNNSARYFEYYFSKYPNIIRKNRNSIGILTGNETPNELNGLCNDIFLYFGRGCRNVSKIYIPVNYSFEKLIKAFKKFNNIIDNKKYFNNYIYNKTILSINNIPFLDNGFIILKEDSSLTTPVSVLNYEFYRDINILHSEILEKSENIQCIVSKNIFNQNVIPFGKTQFPELWNYSDNINVISFLANL
jgi:hypothetical protein